MTDSRRSEGMFYYETFTKLVRGEKGELRVFYKAVSSKEALRKGKRTVLGGKIVIPPGKGYFIGCATASFIDSDPELMKEAIVDATQRIGGKRQSVGFLTGVTEEEFERSLAELQEKHNFNP